jgi:hypothetical protein
MNEIASTSAIPAKAGTQGPGSQAPHLLPWAAAFAGLATATNAE